MVAARTPAWWLYLAVALGAALGGGIRELLAGALAAGTLPWATWLANVAGSFLIGLHAGLPGHSRWHQGALPLFVSAGLCGGLTTFSLFSLEVLLRPAEQLIMTAGWVLLSLAGWLLAVAAGYRTGLTVGGH